MTRSSSAGLSSMLRLYLKPEHPPGSTAMRSPAVSGETFSSAMNFLTSTAACSVTVRVMGRSEEHTSELQSLAYLVCRLLLEKKNRPYSFAELEGIRCPFDHGI